VAVVLTEVVVLQGVTEVQAAHLVVAAEVVAQALQAQVTAAEVVLEEFGLSVGRVYIEQPKL
jgi:hypothetical protein